MHEDAHLEAAYEERTEAVDVDQEEERERWTAPDPYDEDATMHDLAVFAAMECGSDREEAELLADDLGVWF